MKLRALIRDADPCLWLPRRTDRFRDPGYFIRALAVVARRVGCKRGYARGLDRLRGLGARFLESRKRRRALHRVEARREHDDREADSDRDRRDDPERQSAAVRVRLLARLADASAYVVKIGHREAPLRRRLTLPQHSLIFVFGDL
jgi:hypothetical protein